MVHLHCKNKVPCSVLSLILVSGLSAPTGTILSDSSDYNYVGKNITDSDSDFLNRQSVKGARPKGIMKSNVLAVICPLTGSKETKGYLVLLTPQKAIKEEATLILDTILICYLLLLFGICHRIFAAVLAQCISSQAACTQRQRVRRWYFDQKACKIRRS